MKVSGNTKVHEVRLMQDDDDTTYTTIASIPIRMYPATSNNAYVYRDLATPVRLESGKTYVLVSREFPNVSENHCGESSMTGLAPAVFKNVDPDKPKACWFQWTSNSVGTKTDSTSNGTCFGGVNLKYY